MEYQGHDQGLYQGQKLGLFYVFRGYFDLLGPPPLLSNPALAVSIPVYDRWDVVRHSEYTVCETNGTSDTENILCVTNRMPRMPLTLNTVWRLGIDIFEGARNH
jgi:hypothetical protein